MFRTQRKHQKATSAPGPSNRRAHIPQYTWSPSALKVEWSARGCCQWPRPGRQNFTNVGPQWHLNTPKAPLGFVWSVCMAFELDLPEVCTWGTCCKMSMKESNFPNYWQEHTCTTDVGGGMDDCFGFLDACNNVNTCLYKCKHVRSWMYMNGSEICKCEFIYIIYIYIYMTLHADT